MSNRRRVAAQALVVILGVSLLMPAAPLRSDAAPQGQGLSARTTPSSPRRPIATGGSHMQPQQLRPRDAARASTIITTIAGGGVGNLSPAATGMNPAGVVVDGAGNPILADAANGVIWLANLTPSTITRFGQTVAPSHMVAVAGDDSTDFGGDSRPATHAALDGPAGVALDGAGNLYIADSGNNRVREVLASSGVITTVAGTGSAGFGGDGGLATQAPLNVPTGVAIDSAGNLYIADSGNNRVREVLASSGVITTVAGAGPGGDGGDGGPATQALLNVPTGVAIDSAGNLYIADSGNNRVREVITASGVITSVAGAGGRGYGGDGGPATQALLNVPTGVALDSAGNLYIADTQNQRIRAVAAGSGVISTVAGSGSAGFSGDGGLATQAQLDYPEAVTVDGAGDLFIADTQNPAYTFSERIREVKAGSGIISTVAGNGSQTLGGDGHPAGQAELGHPSDLAVDRVGDLYLADRDNGRVREVIAGTNVITTVAGSTLCYDFTHDCFSGDGGAATQAQLDQPTGVAVDGAGNLYIADRSNYRIREVVASTGIITTVAGGGFACNQETDGLGDGCPATQAQLNVPGDVAVDGKGNLIIADTGNDSIREVLASSGVITTVAGIGKAGYSGDGGPAAQAQLNLPAGVALDRAGNIYLADTLNNRVRKVIASTGVITTVAGIGTAGFGGDGGPASKATLNLPERLVFDSTGDLFIADSGNNRIREIIAGTGVITTVAGSGSTVFSGDGGPPTQAGLNFPSGLALSLAGGVIIADSGNNRIRVIKRG